MFGKHKTAIERAAAQDDAEIARLIAQADAYVQAAAMAVQAGDGVHERLALADAKRFRDRAQDQVRHKREVLAGVDHGYDDF